VAVSNVEFGREGVKLGLGAGSAPAGVFAVISRVPASAERSSTVVIEIVTICAPADSVEVKTIRSFSTISW
jgi:hypothetical protein